MRAPGTEIKMVEATPEESDILEGCEAVFQQMINDAQTHAGHTGPICLVHAFLSTAASIVIQRTLSREAFQLMVDHAWECSAKNEVERHRGCSDA